MKYFTHTKKNQSLNGVIATLCVRLVVLQYNTWTDTFND